MRQSKLEVKKMLGEVTRKPSITQMLQRKEPESQMQNLPKESKKITSDDNKIHHYHSDFGMVVVDCCSTIYLSQ